MAPASRCRTHHRWGSRFGRTGSMTHLRLKPRSSRTASPGTRVGWLLMPLLTMLSCVPLPRTSTLTFATHERPQELRPGSPPPAT